jgi:hypothetical protein
MLRLRPTLNSRLMLRLLRLDGGERAVVPHLPNLTPCRLIPTTRCDG